MQVNNDRKKEREIFLLELLTARPEISIRHQGIDANIYLVHYSFSSITIVRDF